MYKKFNELSFVIGLFFFLLSLILAGGYFFSDHSTEKINLYCGIVFFAFGIFMMNVRSREHTDEES